MGTKHRELQQPLDSIDMRLTEERGTVDLHEQCVTMITEITKLDHI